MTDSGLSGGISGIKQHMKAVQNNIKEINEKAEKIEQDVVCEKQRYAKGHQRQAYLKDQILDKEESIRRNETKLLEVTRRHEEKQLFLKESKKFSASLIQQVPEEGRVEELEKRLKYYKEIYANNYTRHQKARDVKIELDQKIELMENRSHAFKRKVAALTTELEYNQKEEQRRMEGCKEAIDEAFKSEKMCIEIERGMDAVMRRKEAAIKKINALEAEISKVESNVDTLNFDRRRIEATIKEYLQNFKNNT